MNECPTSLINRSLSQHEVRFEDEQKIHINQVCLRNAQGEYRYKELVRLTR